MTTIGCPSETELSAYLSGATTALAPEVLQAHLDECADCRMVVTEAVRPFTPAAGMRTLGPGERLADRYVIRRFVASGGMGEVYEAHDDLLRERVALKTLRCTALDCHAAVARIRAEVQLARRVTHPNVCRILEFGVHVRNGEEIPFFTMELLAGVTLGEKIAASGPLPADAVALLARELAGGLAAVHAAGIVHRDLKSDNVFLVPREGEGAVPWRTVVMDFGLARSTVREFESLASSGVVVGTAAYMSPEQLLGEKATPRSDIYALGVVLFQAITGELPFPGRSIADTAVRRVLEPAPPPSRVNPAVSRRWDALIGRCLEREPEARFASMEEVISALDDGVPARPRRARAAGGGGRWLFAGFAAAAATAGGAMLWLEESGEEADLTPLAMPHIVETVDTGWTFTPAVAANPSGAAVAVWVQEVREVRRADLWGNFHDPEKGWGAARLLEELPGNAKVPQVSIDEAGRATAVWLQGPAGHASAYGIRFDPATGWGEAFRLDPEASGIADRPRVASAPGGATMAVWQQIGERGSVIRARSFGSAWSPPETVSVGAEPARYPDVAVDPHGAAMVVYTQVKGYDLPHARRFVPSSGWEAPQPLDAGAAARYPAVALDGAGRGLVTWRRSKGDHLDLHAADFVPGRGFSPPQPLEDGAESVDISRVALDAAGNGLATWHQARREGGAKRVWARAFTFTAGWGPPQRLDDARGGPTARPDLRMSADGHAAVSWYEPRTKEQPGDAWVATYHVRTGWRPARLVDSGEEAALDPVPVLTAGGRGFVLWTQSSEGEGKLWSAVLD